MSVDRPFALVIDKDDKIRCCYCEALVEALEGLLTVIDRDAEGDDDAQELMMGAIDNANAVLKRVREGA